MARRKILEILLDRVQIEETGGRASRDAQHLLLVTLVWPRARVEECVAVKPISLDQKAADLRKSMWIERILFKELVQGPFGMHVGGHQEDLQPGDPPLSQVHWIPALRDCRKGSRGPRARAPGRCACHDPVSVTCISGINVSNTVVKQRNENHSTFLQ